MAPRPASLSTCTSPPDCLAKPYTCDRPRPVPLPTPLVVKNGSKIRPMASGAMPEAVSDTDTATKVRAGALGRAATARSAGPISQQT